MSHEMDLGLSLKASDLEGIVAALLALTAKLRNGDTHGKITDERYDVRYVVMSPGMWKPEEQAPPSKPKKKSEWRLKR